MSTVDLAPGWEVLVLAAAGPAIRTKAEAVLSYAISTAPVDTGAYRDSLRMDELPGGGWRISANVPHAIYVEFGTRYMAAYHTLAVALDAAKG